MPLRVVWPSGCVLLLALALARPAGAQDPASSRPERRGPIESRDEWLLARPRLSLPAASPDPLRAREWRLRLDLDWGSDFGYQERRLDGEFEPLFLVDGEHRVLALEAGRGITDRFGASLRLPLRWQGGGFLDGVIDAFHRITGLPGGARPLFPRDRLRVEGRDTAGRAIEWTGREGTGLGALEVAAWWSLVGPHRSGHGPEGWSAALVGRAALPTGSGPFGDGSLGGGVQLVAARPLGSAWDVYVGLGTTASTRRQSHGVAYRSTRPSGFLALEWRPLRAASLVVQVDAAGRLVTNLATYPGFTVYFRMAAKLDLSPRWRVEGGFTEGIRGLDAATDFGILVGVARRF